MRLFVLMLVVVALAGLGCSSEEAAKTDAGTSSSDSAEITFSEFDTAPKPIKIISPDYPVAAKNDEVTGTTHVELIVDETGHVQKTRVIKSSGDDRLDEAAEEAALKCLFEPARNQGTAVAAKIVLPIKFALD
jgi:TonB family protein